MLLRYFGFRKQPFGSTPDPHFLFTHGQHAEVLARLQRGFSTGARLELLITPVGLGKTTILFSLSEFVQPLARHIFIYNGFLNAADLLGAIAAQLGLSENLPSGVFALRAAVDERFKALHSVNKRLFVIIDEAQDLDSSGLAELGALLQRAPKSIQFVVAGQPELQEKLRHPGMFAWRNSKPLTLKPLGPAEVALYVEHQLLVAGYKGPPIFTPDALARISDLSGGVPRVINQLCSDALMKAFSMYKTVVDEQLLVHPIDYVKLARSLDNVVNMDSVLPAAAVVPAPQIHPPLRVPRPAANPIETPPSQTAKVETTLEPMGPAATHDPLTTAIHSWLQQRATIWTGTAGELLSGLREFDNSAFAQTTPKELARQLEAALPCLRADGIQAELRPNPNGPRMIALRMVPASEPVRPDETSFSEARRATG